MSPLLIAGFHRSGTSAVARSFHAAGLHLGDELIGAEPANPHGHFEDTSAVALHDAILERSGRTWKSLSAVSRPLAGGDLAQLAAYVTAREAGGKPWGVKDPRICLFLPEWIAAAPNARLIVVIRRPDEAVRSLHMRHSRRHVVTRGVDPSDLDFWRQPDLGVELWVHYHRALLESMSDDDTVHVVDFGDRPSIDALVPTVVARWDLELDPADVPTLDPQLGNSGADPIEVRSSELLEEASHVWSELKQKVYKN